jgi:hypothetical protein
VGVAHQHDGTLRRAGGPQVQGALAGGAGVPGREPIFVSTDYNFL